MTYNPADDRYENMIYNRCGRSGLVLPAISLGLWQNFGSIDDFETGRNMIHRAFDRGITHFDLANNYGPVPGSAEENFGKILKQDFSSLRDELIISTKAGYEMWAGPYGNFGSRKYLLASLDQSLKRMQLPYVDIFYSHRPDPDTPIEETIRGACFFTFHFSLLHFALLKISSIPCNSSRVKSKLFSESILSSNCFTELDPIKTEVTLLSFNNQAMAICASV